MPVLRVLEGCARTLVGTVERANVIKLGRLEPKVFCLAYHKDRPAEGLLKAITRVDAAGAVNATLRERLLEPASPMEILDQPDEASG